MIAAMTIDALIMFVGAFVATLPFLGFPHSWQTPLFFAAGVVVIALGIVVRRRAGRAPDRRHLDFEEHDPRRADAHHEDGR